MEQRAQRLKSVSRLAEAYAEVPDRLKPWYKGSLGAGLAGHELDVVSCIWFSAHLECLGEEHALERIGNALRENWDVLELPFGFEEASPLIEALTDVAMRSDSQALLGDIERKFAGLCPALAAHELILQAGNANRRSRRGVFTTPDALADYLVSRADAFLREEFQLKLGIADTATWREVATRVPLVIPEGVNHDQPLIRILDAATGSGVFPLAVARRARSNWLAYWLDEGLSPSAAKRRWITQAGPELGQRLVLYEILPVARALARWHLKAAFGSTAPRIEAINPLAEFNSLPFPITVCLGNPPYSVRSGSLDRVARGLIEPYRFESGRKLVEKGALRLEMHLQDDYVKFIRLAELQVQRAGVGVVSLVANHSFLDSPSLRGMRNCLVERFDRIELLNLHGSRTRRTQQHKDAGDQNVFKIGQGVATMVASASAKKLNSIRYGELVGARSTKLERLADCTSEALPAMPLDPSSPHWLLVPRDTKYAAIYDQWVGLKDLFHTSVSGIVTAHDHLVVGFDDQALRQQAKLLLDEGLSIAELRLALRVRDNAGWKLERARDQFRQDPRREDAYRNYAYRPFDTRRLLYHSSLVWCDRRRVMSALDGENVALAVCRQLAAPPWKHVFATRELMDDNFVSNRSRERTHLFPLFRRLDPGDVQSPLVANFNQASLDAIVPDGVSASPHDVFCYVYAILHSAEYRERHCDSLAVDFPRIPPALNQRQFQRWMQCGRLLLGAHLPTTREPAQQPLQSMGSGVARVERGFPRFENERVFLNLHYCLGPIAKEQWGYVIGAYAPCQKWLKDRTGLSLGSQDLAEYARLVHRVATSLSILEDLPALPIPAARSLSIDS